MASISAFTALGYSIGNFLSGRYSERIGLEPMMLRGALISTLAPAVTALLIVSGIDNAVSFFIPLSLVGVGNGMTLPNAMAAAISLKPDAAGASSGLLGAIQIGLGAARVDHRSHHRRRRGTPDPAVAVPRCLRHWLDLPVARGGPHGTSDLIGFARVARARASAHSPAMTRLAEKPEAQDRLIIAPDPLAPGLSTTVEGIDHTGQAVTTRVVAERPLTLYLNRQEIVTMMTIGDHPDLLGIGYLLNQNMLAPDNPVTGVDYDEDLGVVVVRTERETDFETKMQKKVRTSGCAQGTVFGDVMDGFDSIELQPDARLKTSWLYALTRKINTTPSLYLEAGAIHGCVLCQEDRPLVYMEDVGRHNAVDKIAGWMHLNGVDPADKIFYTTGRLTSEMVIKTVMMRIPVLVSRSGFTAWGVELARQAGLTLIGRARGKRFLALSAAERIVFDLDPDSVPDEDRKTGPEGIAP